MAGLMFGGVDMTDAFLNGTFTIPPEKMTGEMKARTLCRLIELTVRRKDPNARTLTEGLSYRSSNNTGERIFDLGIQPAKDRTIILLTFSQPPQPRPQKHWGDCAPEEMPPHVPAPVTSEHLLLTDLFSSVLSNLIFMTVRWEAFWSEPADDDCRAYTEPLNWRAVHNETSSVPDERLAELLMRQVTEPFVQDPLRQACYQLAHLDKRRLEVYEDKYHDEKRRSEEVQGMLARMGIRS